MSLDLQVPMQPARSAVYGTQLDSRWMVGFFKSLEGLPESEVEDRILEVQERMLRSMVFDPENNPMPVVHHHAPDIYLREIFMPAQTFVIGAKHKTDHYNIILTGSALVLMEGKLTRVDAPLVVRTGAGVKKVLLILKDMRWLTVHSNPDQETDEETLEEMLTDEPPTKIHREVSTRNRLRNLDLKLRGLS